MEITTCHTTKNNKPINNSAGQNGLKTAITHHNRQTFGNLGGQAELIAPLGVDLGGLGPLAGAQTAKIWEITFWH